MNLTDLNCCGNENKGKVRDSYVLLEPKLFPQLTASTIPQLTTS